MSKLTMTQAAIAALATDDIDNFFAAAAPGGIEAQEAAGQKKLCKDASLLPIDLGYSAVIWPQIEEAWSIKHGKVVDKVFYSVQLPEGWKIKPTNHSMWSDLIDQNGSTRAAIFFKAAFYDYEANMNLQTRYRMTSGSRPDMATPFSRTAVVYSVNVTDEKTKNIIFQGALSDYDHQYDAAQEFLNVNYPDHKNPFAYWNA